MHLPDDPAFILEKWNLRSPKNLYTNALVKSQKTENNTNIQQVNVKQNVVYPHHEIILSNKKRTFDIYNIGGFRKYSYG